MGYTASLEELIQAQGYTIAFLLQEREHCQRDAANEFYAAGETDMLRRRIDILEAQLAATSSRLLSLAAELPAAVEASLDKRISSYTRRLDCVEAASASFATKEDMSDQSALVRDLLVDHAAQLEGTCAQIQVTVLDSTLPRLGQMLRDYDAGIQRKLSELSARFAEALGGTECNLSAHAAVSVAPRSIAGSREMTCHEFLQTAVDVRTRLPHVAGVAAPLLAICDAPECRHLTLELLKEERLFGPDLSDDEFDCERFPCALADCVPDSPVCWED